MLTEEKGIVLLRDLLSYEGSHPIIRQNANLILQTIELNCQLTAYATDWIRTDETFDTAA